MDESCRVVCKRESTGRMYVTVRSVACLSDRYIHTDRVLYNRYDLIVLTNITTICGKNGCRRPFFTLFVKMSTIKARAVATGFTFFGRVEETITTTVHVLTTPSTTVTSRHWHGDGGGGRSGRTGFPFGTFVLQVGTVIGIRTILIGGGCHTLGPILD